MKIGDILFHHMSYKIVHRPKEIPFKVGKTVIVTKHKKNMDRTESIKRHNQVLKQSNGFVMNQTFCKI